MPIKEDEILVIPEADFIVRKKIFSTRQIDLSDQYETTFWYVEADFLKRKSQGSINSLKVVENPILKYNFERKRDEFGKKGIPLDCIITYHGTKPENHSSILHNNFDLAKIRVYLSECYGEYCSGFQVSFHDK